MNYPSKKILSALFLAMLAGFIFLNFAGSELRSAEVSEESRYVLIHLDGISAENFYDNMEAGELPNLADFFYEEKMRGRAITYFPPSTPTIITKLKEGKRPGEGKIVDWDGYSPELGRTYSQLESTAEMISSKGRRSQETFMQGVPGFHIPVGRSLGNLPYLLDDYRILEFYWFSTDFFAHAFGGEAQQRELERFDRDFGRFVEGLDDKQLQNLNVIIYADHGMNFGELVEVEEDVKETADDYLKAYSYPNIYLEEIRGIRRSREKKDQLARDVVEQSKLDLAFYRSSAGEIKGYGPESRIRLSLAGEDIDGGISYEYEGRDVFGYYEAGYEGEYLTPEEWLEKTGHLDFPAAPVNLMSLMKNPEAGDIVVVLNPPKFTGGGYVREASHLSLEARDMTVPLLVRGDQLKSLYEEEYIWLPDLFSHKLDVDFDGAEPERENHSLSLWTGAGEAGGSLSLSPTYRVRLGYDNFGGGDSAAWAEYDVYSSYLHRLWLGSGLNEPHSSADLTGRLRYDLRLRRLVASYINFFNGRDSEQRLRYELSSSLDLKVFDFEKLGLRISW